MIPTSKNVPVCPETAYDQFSSWADLLGNNRFIKTTDKWVSLAEKLAASHNDILPCKHWLSRNGYSGLVYQLITYPQKFSDIEQSKPRKKVEDYVALAKEVAKRYKGILPCAGWLNQNGYSGLVRMMRFNEDKFSEILQEKKKVRRPLSEYVKLAKKLSSKHGGLPTATWLNQNGFQSLYLKIRKHPKLFENIKKKRGHAKHLTIDEKVIEAEKIAIQNGGEMPRPQKLKKIKKTIYEAMCNYPEKFAHIRREGK